MNDMLNHFPSTALPDTRCIAAIKPPFVPDSFVIVDSHPVTGVLHKSGWMLEDGCT